MRISRKVVSSLSFLLWSSLHVAASETTTIQHKGEDYLNEGTLSRTRGNHSRSKERTLKKSGESNIFDNASKDFMECDLCNVHFNDIPNGEIKLTKDYTCEKIFGPWIESDNVVFDCDGHTISGTNEGYSGIIVSGANVVIKNCIFKDFAWGVNANGENVHIENVHSYDNSENGLALLQDNFTLKKVVASNNGQGGITIFNGSTGGTFDDVVSCSNKHDIRFLDPPTSDTVSFFNDITFSGITHDITSFYDGEKPCAEFCVY